MANESPDQQAEQQKVMGLMEHLGELRDRIVKSLGFVLVAFCVAMYFSVPILEFLKSPLRVAIPDADNLLHFTSPMEPFIAQIKVSFLSAFIAGSPIWLYHFWRFIEPALYDHEKRYVIPFTFASIALFFSGICFCFFLILPMAMKFLIGLGMQSAEAIITISDYISVIMLLIFAFGIIFETPLILILLGMLDLISADTLAKNRKFVFIGILTVGAVMTPPDPISQLAMAGPTYIMFEVSIIIIRFIKREPKEAKETV